MHEYALTELGLSEKEAAMYEALLQKGQALIPDLVKATGFKRGDTYNILAGLEAWGLAEKKEKDGKNYYVPAHPTKLNEAVADQEKEVESTKKALNSAIPDLVSMYNLAINKPGVRFFEGKEGVIQAYETLLDIRQPILSIEDKGNMLEFFPEYVKKYVNKRIDRQIPSRAIAPDTNTVNTPNPTKFLDSRLIPSAEFPFNMDIKICGDLVQLATLKEGQAVAVHLYNPIIAANFKIIFEYMWKQVSHIPPKNHATNNSSSVVLNPRT